MAGRLFVSGVGYHCCLSVMQHLHCFAPGGSISKHASTPASLSRPHSANHSHVTGKVKCIFQCGWLCKSIFTSGWHAEFLLLQKWVVQSIVDVTVAWLCDKPPMLQYDDTIILTLLSSLRSFYYYFFLCLLFVFLSFSCAKVCFTIYKSHYNLVTYRVHVLILIKFITS